MNRKALHTALDTESLDTPAPEVLEHLAECAACRRAWAQARTVQETLRAFPEPPVPPGFAERVLAFTDISRERRPHRAAWGWGLALAASLLLGIGIGIALVWNTHAPPDGYQVRNGAVLVQAGTVTTVRIALDAARPIQDVGFVVNVPAGMELQGHPGEQQVAWNGALAAGRNVLALQLIAAKPGTSGTLETELHYGERNSSFKLHVVAVGDSGLRERVRRFLTKARLG